MAYILAVNAGIVADTGGTCSDSDCTVSLVSNEACTPVVYCSSAVTVAPTELSRDQELFRDFIQQRNMNARDRLQFLTQFDTRLTH